MRQVDSPLSRSSLARASRARLAWSSVLVLAALTGCGDDDVAAVDGGADAAVIDASMPDGGVAARCEPSSFPGALDDATWDPRFTIAGFTGQDGFAPAVHDFARDTDGSLLVAGRFQYLGAERVAPLLRLRDGVWTEARETWELPLPPGGFSAVAVDPSGALALATHDVFGELTVEIWVDDGTGLRVIAHADGLVRSLAWVDGALWAAGVMTLDEGAITNLAVWDGTSWSAPPGGAVDGPVYELLVEGDHVVVGGNFTQIGGIAAGRVAEWDGAAWTAFELGQGAVYTLARDAMGVLHAGGVVFGTEPGAPGGLLRWTGSAWELVGGGLANPGFTGVVVDLARDGDDLVIAGCFTHANGASDSPGAIDARSLARWDGSTWEALDDGTQGVGSVWFHSASCGDEGPAAIFDALYQRIAVDEDRVFFGGSFPGVGPVASQTIVAHDGTGWVAQGAAGEGLAGSMDVVAVGGPDCAVHGLGTMTHAGGDALASTVVRWNGTGWTTPGPRLPSDLYCSALTVAGDGSVLVGCGENEPEGPEPRGALLRLVDETWVPIEGIAELGPVQHLAIDREGRVWIVGGSSTGYVARWDGSELEVIERSIDALVYRIEIGEREDGTERVLIAGGFTKVGTVDAVRIASFDGTTWSALGAGLPSTPMALEIAGDAVYASTADEGGEFYGLGRWNGTSWTELATAAHGVPSLESFSVTALLARGDELLVAGSIMIGPDTRPKSVFVFDGDSFTPLGGGVGAIFVSSLALTRDALWLGGSIGTVNIDGEEISSVGVARRSWSE